ncbi:hypothetical protein ACNKHX_03065 [Shigella flexneri]
MRRKKTLPELATRLAAQLKKYVVINVYDAERILVTAGVGQGEPLFGPVLTIKVFDYQLDIPGVQTQTHPWQPVRFMALNWPCSRMNTVIWCWNPRR